MLLYYETIRQGWYLRGKMLVLFSSPVGITITKHATIIQASTGRKNAIGKSEQREDCYSSLDGDESVMLSTSVRRDSYEWI